MTVHAYCWPQSALPGETVSLHVSSDAGPVSLEIVRRGRTDETVASETGIAAGNHPTPPDAASKGCGWPVAATVPISDDWRSGFYLVRLSDASGATTEAFFVVRAPKEKRSRMLLVLSTSTWAAYNDWGGPSYYTGGNTSSLTRPLPKGFLQRPEPKTYRSARFGDLPKGAAGSYFKQGYSFWVVAAGWSAWEYLFVQWAEANGYALDYAVSADLERVPDLLDGYDAYVSVGHDEYWSSPMRDAVEGFVERGGRAAFFSGNTAFWQVRYEDGGTRQIGYKMDIKNDPVVGTPDERFVSTMWSDPMTGRPENQMTGSASPAAAMLISAIARRGPAATPSGGRSTGRSRASTCGPAT